MAQGKSGEGNGQGPGKNGGKRRASAAGDKPKRPTPPRREATDVPSRPRGDTRARPDSGREARAARPTEPEALIPESKPARTARATTPEPPPPPRPSRATTPATAAELERMARPSIPPLDERVHEVDDDDLIAAEPVVDEDDAVAADGDAPPDALPPDDAWGDDFFGEEAAPPPGEFGPGLDNRREIPYTRKAVTEEVRELERRVKARLTPAFPIEHRRRLPLEFVWKRLRELAMRDRSDVVDEFGRDPMVAGKVKPLLDFLYDTYFRVEVHGIEHLPASGRALLVANHSGTLPYDGAMLMHAVRRETEGHRELRPLVEDFVFHFPYLGTFMNRIGGVRACQENAERLLEDDQLVAVFPEGIKGIGKLFKDRYRLQRFGRGGFVKLALRTGAPIIPVAIVGAEEIHPMIAKITGLARSLGAPYLPITPTFPLLGPLGLLPIPTKWTIRIGPPMDLGVRHGPQAASDRILIGKLAESVRTSIQDMLNETLSKRKSAIFG
jgi:1-acyl-sn-glycerol-3-phosphate acyltransferase